MASEPESNEVMSRTGEAPHALSTHGAMARRRRWRIALLVALSLLLLGLLYSLYYYSQNHRAPSITLTTDNVQKVQPLQYLYSFAGTGARAMSQPSGVAVIGNRCYVTDYAFRTVRAYTVNGDYLFDFTGVKMSSPVHMAVGPDNTVWVTDRVLRALFVFDQNGKFLRKFLPNGDAKFDWSPLAIAFSPDGELYVTDVGNTAKHQVIVLDPTTAKVKRQWGSSQQVVQSSDAPGKFYFPNGIVVKGKGASALVFVSDGDNRRVQVFKTDGTFVRIINTSGTPRGITVDSAGIIYVVDALAHRVDMYDDKGDMLATFGENGTDPGQFSFPNDIVIGNGGRAYIADRNNDQVQVWGPLVAEIPGITKITPSTAWVPFLVALLIALPLIALARRKKRFAVTPDFVGGMIAANAVAAMNVKRFRWVMTEADQPQFEGRVVDHVDLGELLNAEPYSETDAQAIVEKLGVPVGTARLLAIAKRCRILCTEDIDLARYAVRLGVDVYDRVTWLEKFGKKR